MLIVANKPIILRLYSECHYAECRGAKKLVRDKHVCLLFSSVSDEGKSFIKLAPGGPLHQILDDLIGQSLKQTMTSWNFVA
jgi:hypothetical protein